ncbi:serine hydrolase domain-containing protein [Hydrotalea flava]|uniref:serine hydrolase domain-containing protein n=1 Tax=Hydrotalea flava TaxID=714549 RepID=UPI00142EF3D4|nr:serine hydrolase domain-containing protein [Hydrotalea flava]
MSVKNVKTCCKVSLVIGILLFFQVSYGQYNFVSLQQQLTAAKKELGKNYVCMVYKEGKIVFKQEEGDIKTNTQIPIAGSSKWLTAALVMTFVEQGKLSLDDKVSNYLPIFATYGKAYITIRQCLSHLTGIQSPPGIVGVLQKNKYVTLEEEVNAFASKREIQDNPGVAFRYSNIGLNIAARVVEVISKKQFDQLMAERIFRPLNMRNSSFYSNRAVNPSDGAVTTAADYMNFLAMLLNNGVFNNRRILSEKAIEEMEKAETNLSMIQYAPAIATGYNYGLGAWIIGVNAQGIRTAMASPGATGCYPWIDRCHNYAALIFEKSNAGEQQKEWYVDFKKTIDTVIPGSCE